MPTIRTGDIVTYYERHGDGYPIVFAHGSAWDHRQWAPQIETLAREYEIITYDARFHGKTEPVEEEHDIGPNFLAEDLQSFIEALDIGQKPVVVGLSMGGAVAHVHAEMYPDSTAGLVTYEAPLSVQSPTSLKMRMAYRVMLGAFRVVGASRAYAFNEWVMQKVTGMEESQDVVVDGLGMTKEEYVKDAMSRADWTGQRKILQKGLVHDNLSAVSVPTLAIVGENAAETHVEAAADLASGILGADQAVLEDADHGGNITNVGGFNELLREFVENRVE